MWILSYISQVSPAKPLPARLFRRARTQLGASPPLRGVVDSDMIAAYKGSLSAIAWPAVALALAIGLGCSSGVKAQRTASDSNRSDAAVRAPAVAGRAGSLHHYEYVFPDGSMYVYDLDARQRLVQRVDLPMAKGIRGVVASPVTHTLYISYGGDGGDNGSGSLLAYDLVAGRVLWQRSYRTGIDSMAVSPDGARIYMPSGRAGFERRVGGARRPRRQSDREHPRGLGRSQHGHEPRRSPRVPGRARTRLPRGRRHGDKSRRQEHRPAAQRRAGRSRSTGARRSPSRRRRGSSAFRSAAWSPAACSTRRRSRASAGAPLSFSPSAPSHGISLSPNERRVWVMDAPNGYVHVFDVSSLPRHAPRLLRNLRLSHPMSGEESPCSYDCARDGWIQHSLTGASCTWATPVTCSTRERSAGWHTWIRCTTRARCSRSTGAAACPSRRARDRAWATCAEPHAARRRAAPQPRRVVSPACRSRTARSALRRSTPSRTDWTARRRSCWRCSRASRRRCRSESPRRRCSRR